MNDDAIAPLVSKPFSRKLANSRHVTLPDDVIMASNSQQVANLCDSLAVRKELCSTCQSTTEKISAFLVASNSETIEERPVEDLFWPLREGGTEEYVDGLRFLPPPAVLPKHEEKPPPNVIRHHEQAKNLPDSAKQCPFCELIRTAIILDALRQIGYPFDEVKEPLSNILVGVQTGKGSKAFDEIMKDLCCSTESIYIILNSEISFGGMSFEESCNRRFRLNHFKVMWQRSETSITTRDRRVVFTRLNVFPSRDTGSDVEKYISQRLPLRSSGSLDAFDRIATWLHTCRAKHRKCRWNIERKEMDSSEIFTLPSRVIDVRMAHGADEPRLIETTGQMKGRWAALSHCWGDSEHHPLMTTKSNLESHKNGIPFSKLPKTFVQAVIMTRILGLRYLWIDSLCIIQDKEEDWLVESKTMGMIYQNAFVTLAASSAINSTKGLFLPRDYGKLQIPSVTLPLRNTSECKDLHQKILGHYSVGIEWRQEPFMYPPDPTFTLLATRGWATQEWILSRRVIHFLSQGLVWVCHSHAEDETGQQIIGRGLAQAEWCTEWGRIIQEHSGRRFTHIEDRLLSLEGLAREISKTKGYRRVPFEKGLEEWQPRPAYWEGVFENDIPEHVLWNPLSHGAKHGDFPTWSWASHPGQIFLRFREFDSHREDESFRSVCKVLGYHQKKKSLGLNAKRLRIDELLTGVAKQKSAPVMKVCYRGPYYDGVSIGQPGKEPFGWVCFDDERDLGTTDPLFFLHLATIYYWKAPQTEYYGLILKQNSGDDDLFIRVGLGATWDDAFLENATELDTWLV